MRIILSADDFGRSHSRNLAIDYAMKNGFIKSAALIINSKYTDEAIEFAIRGRYLNHIHLHLNLAYGEQLSGDSKPCCSEFANCSVFCENREYRHPFYYEPDFYKYIDVTFKELESQYLKFVNDTDSMANLSHIDVHIYNNRSFPFAAAYYQLIQKYGISSARYFSVPHFTLEHPKEESFRLRLAKFLCGSSGYKCKSCNVDYFLTRKKDFFLDNLVELYVHPDYIDGVLMDNTESCFGHKKELLENQIKHIQNNSFKLISWVDV